MLIDVELDGHPEETRWMLSALLPNDGKDAAYEGVVRAEPVGSYTGSEAGEVLRYRVLVDAEGWYNLTIFDSAGDGFAGTLDVGLDAGVESESTSLVREPGFTEVLGNAVSYAMYVGSSPPRFMMLNLLFDGPVAKGVAYELRNNNDDIILTLAWYETYRSATGLEAVRIPIYGPAGGDRTYALTFWAGNVTYELYLGDLGDGTLLNGGSGAGRTDEVFWFVIDGESPFPTSAPSSLVSRSLPTDSPPVAEGPASPGNNNYERPTTIDYTPTTADDYHQLHRTSHQHCSHHPSPPLPPPLSP